MTTASAPAKAILIGEHTALYGKPAVAVALEPRAYVSVTGRADSEVFITAPDIGISKMPANRYEKGSEMIMRSIGLVGGGFDIEIKSKIPTASGLGSSASISSALMMALLSEAGKNTGKDIVAKDAWECENAVHGKSSGIDPFAVTYGGITYYRMGKVEQLPSKGFPRLVVAHSGTYSDTGDVVAAVDSNRVGDPLAFDSFLDQSEELAHKGRELIRAGRWRRVGKLMDENHRLLCEVGVSTKRLDELVAAAREAGAYGAKLSGAGRGGVIIALCDEKSKNPVIKALSSLDAKIIQTRFSEDGVRLE